MQRGGRRLPAFALIVAALTVLWAAVPGTAIRAEASSGTKSALAAPPGAPGNGGAADAAGPAGAPDPADANAEKDPSWTVTLVTGDVVKLTGKQGHQAAQVVKDEPTGGKSISVIGKDKDVYVVPGAAAPMIAAGQLDQDLFDVSKLAREGYAEPNAGTLPVLVTYKSDADAVKAEGEHRLAGATVTRHLESVQGLAAEVDLKQTRQFFESLSGPASTTEGMRGEAHAASPQTARPEVAKVWLNGKVHATLDGSRTAIGADKAWAAGYAGAGVTVAVLDTGIDESHPDLAGQVVDRQSFVPGVQSVKDGHGHGTHVAGTIAGTGVASGGEYAGMAPKTRLAIGKVLDDKGSGSWSDIIAGMEWAAGKAKVVSMSLGGGVSDGNDPMSQALNNISRRTGALFVVAAGNNFDEQTINTPGAADLALTVGAADHGCCYMPGNRGQTAGRGSKRSGHRLDGA